jgi:hypothetical protein
MNLLQRLGIDPETFEWSDLAACKGMGTAKEVEQFGDLFYDQYERSPVVAEQVDQICLTCPVIAACSKAGQVNKEEGVWGGVYWDGTGKPDKTRNKHKTRQVWDQIKSLTGVASV